MSRKISNHAVSRLKQDYIRLKRDPVPYITAEPLPSNILEWHYIVQGPQDSPYEGGYYHGKLVFPIDFPFKPPSIYMITPSGRFRVNTRLCLSISDYHPDTWNPAWSVSTILTGLLSFMLEKSPTLGSLETSDYEKRNWAAASLEFNLKKSVVKELFPEIYEKMSDEVQRRKLEAENAAKSASVESGSPSASSHIVGITDRLQSCLTNFGVLACVIAFGWVVQFVLSSIDY
ncbi:ubiquitin-conjugating enzyme E2 J2-like [Artemia franciscana]|uniref:ubiquitin-conjugating enzyme E2 J2-like n=1 Tax=Artemia franciscana TaxID=6661 RepID=UPI0032D9C08F